MNIKLTHEPEQLVHSHVQSVRYGSASEVIREALRLLADRDETVEIRERELQDKIAQGLDSLRLGKGLDGEEFFAQLERDETALHQHPAG